MENIQGRREFLITGLSAAAMALGVAMKEREQSDPLGVYKRSLVLDTMLIEGKSSMDAAKAVAAGFTAAVVDIEGYPRDAASGTAAMERWKGRFEAEGSLYLKVLKGADIRNAKRESKFGVILTSQDASILGAASFSSNNMNIQKLQWYHEQGLRILQITHSDRNGLGDSYMETTNAGLSRLGTAVVQKMNELRMLIDLSHVGEQTSIETIKLSTRPCAFTHAGCKALYKTGRNKSDKMIRMISDRGGYLGIFNMSVWLTDSDAPTTDHLVDHILHAVDVAGVDHVGFGSDTELVPNLPGLDEYFKGFSSYMKRTLGQPGSEKMPKHVHIRELYTVDRMERLAFALSKRGMPDTSIEKVLGGNFVRVFEEVCG